MGIVRLLGVVCASLFATACLPVTTAAPVGSTTAMAPDPALTGMWKGRPPKESQDVYFTFLPQSDGTITAVFTEPNGKDAGWGVYSLKTSMLGAYRYMNVHDVSADGKAAGDSEAQSNFPVLYRINGDGALVIYLMDEKRADAAIKATKIAGTVDASKYGDTSITASASDLDAFMGSPAGRALFNAPLLILHKMK
ncbi:MAG TPA: hypothetical protein VGG36_09880 [Rhizomicrobium sp.]|jgi:hypothetical protein